MKRKLLRFTIAIILGLLCLTTFAGAKKIVPADDLVDIINYEIFLNYQVATYSGTEAPHTTSTVTTPNGTVINVKSYINDYSDTQKADAANYVMQAYPSVTILAPATPFYNCHSYAWLYRSTSSTIWMPYPDAYYEDGSYYETDGQVGDIVCYYNENGVNLHSGVIVERRSGTSNGVCGNVDLMTVVSKWGANCLVRHRGDICPYPNDISNPAVTVRYFRHNHRYPELAVPYSDNYHRFYCVYTACDKILDKTHVFETLKPKPYCSICGYNGHTIQPWEYDGEVA